MAAEDYNTLLNTAMVGGSFFAGAHDYDTTSGSVDPFTGDANARPTINGFHLKSETVDAHLNDGFSTAPFFPANNLDYGHKTRGADLTWERGAFEF